MSSNYYSIHSKSRSAFRYRKSYGLVVFVIIILIMSWEAQKMDAAIVNSHIPEEAIRLRILAHSDSPADQAVKRLVRDEIVKAMDSWATGPQTIEEARATITAQMDEIKAITEEVLKSRGFTYGSTAELGIVSFPTKMYGSELYPAGDYEALLITLGAGEGQNWWCVLFPPLCFIDAATGEAAAAPAIKDEADKAQSKDNGAAKADLANGAEQGESSAMTAASGASAASDSSAEADASAAPKAKFFIVELFEKLFSWLGSLFG